MDVPLTVHFFLFFTAPAHTVGWRQSLGNNDLLKLYELVVSIRPWAIWIFQSRNCILSLTLPKPSNFLFFPAPAHTVGWRKSLGNNDLLKLYEVVVSIRAWAIWFFQSPKLFILLPKMSYFLFFPAPANPIGWRRGRRHWSPPWTLRNCGFNEPPGPNVILPNLRVDLQQNGLHQAGLLGHLRTLHLRQPALLPALIVPWICETRPAHRGPTRHRSGFRWEEQRP